MNLRADAARNKVELVASAERIFAEHGADAPLQLVARAAGVGRGTLYRHFPNREALVLAIFEARVVNLEALGPHNSQDPFLAERILISMLDTQARTPGLVTAILGSGKFTQQLASLTDRIVEILDQPIRTAQSAGRVQQDVTPRDFLLAWSMFGWISSPVTEAASARQEARSRQLLLRSLLTPKALNSIDRNL